jgi:Arc/MetJ-type ribon-helix-helix transcriptional regulator
MVIGMALTRKVTVTLPVEQLESVRALVAEGQADSVSGFVTTAVALALEDRLAFEALVDAGLERTGGPMTAQERRWADRVLQSGR